MFQVIANRMTHTRTFNVLTLTTILFLAGCFGMGDSAEAADDHEHTPNAAPVLETGYASIEECNSASCNASIYHAAVDPDGDLIDIGYDFDLDGTIDFTLIEYRGFTNLQIPLTEFETVTSSIVEEVGISDCVSNQKLVVTTTTTTTERITSIALIAVDSNDAASAELITILSPNAVSIESAIVSYTVTCMNTWTFSDRDAAGDMSEAGEDALVHLQMTSGDGLNWANLKVSIVVDGGASMLCVEGDATADCRWDWGGDNIWNVGEEITISEGATTDLCDGADGFCEVVVTLTKIGVGEEDDKVIATVTATADAN
jgi:hypothetical protein